MAKNNVIFREKSNFYFKSTCCPEYLEYVSELSVKNAGKTPVTLKLVFSGIPPFAAPMPPESQSFNATTIADIFPKVHRWAKKYGYEIH